MACRDADEKYFEAMRYMDDLLIVCKDAIHWDMRSFLTDIYKTIASTVRVVERNYNRVV